MDILDVEFERRLSREDAAAWLRRLADDLARHNQLEFSREGVRYTVDVADMVDMEVEIEVGDDGFSLEIELTW